MNEDLLKSIDEMINELFVEEIEKSDQATKKEAQTKADSVVNEAPKGQDDDKRNAGRPKQISDVPKVDKDGKRDGKYDNDISEKSKEEENPEAKKQVKESNQVKKSDDLTSDERLELEDLRKARLEQETEELRKAESQKQEDLIKSVIERVQVRYEEQIESLQKSLKEQTDLVKAIAQTPKTSKSITNISALEKSETTQQATEFSKSEVLDVAESLVKSGKLGMNHVIELENNGYIFDNNARALLEEELNKR